MNDREPEPACARVRGRIEALCDRSLPPLDRARDEGHLEACAGCGRALARHAAVLREARETLEPSEFEWASARRGLDERLLRAKAPRVRRARPWLRAAAIAAAAMVALMLARELETVGGDAECWLGALARVDLSDLPPLEQPRLPELLWR